jgi:hypothetical protein
VCARPCYADHLMVDPEEVVGVHRSRQNSGQRSRAHLAFLRTPWLSIDPSQLRRNRPSGVARSSVAGCDPVMVDLMPTQPTTMFVC